MSTHTLMDGGMEKAYQIVTKINYIYEKEKRRPKINGRQINNNNECKSSALRCGAERSQQKALRTCRRPRAI